MSLLGSIQEGNHMFHIQQQTDHMFMRQLSPRDQTAMEINMKREMVERLSNDVAQRVADSLTFETRRNDRDRNITTTASVTVPCTLEELMHNAKMNDYYKDRMRLSTPAMSTAPLKNKNWKAALREEVNDWLDININ